jgi:hypothetical protein
MFFKNKHLSKKDFSSSSFYLGRNLFKSARNCKQNSFENKMNLLTKLIIISFLSIILFINMNSLRDTSKFSSSQKNISILSIILLFICFFYFGKLFKPSLLKECYGDVPSLHEPIPKTTYNISNKDMIITPSYNQERKCSPTLPKQASIKINGINSNPQLIDGTQSSAYCYGNNDFYSKNYNGDPIQTNISANQKLVGQANPKTMVQPVIPTPIYDFEVWQPNDFVIPTGINNQQNQELYLNGYESNFETFATSQPEQVLQFGPEFVPKKEQIRENFILEEEKPIILNTDNYENISSLPVDMECSYQPKNLNYNLPSNYQATEEEYETSQYNKDLFTIPIQPGIYTKSQVNQPDASMSNLGISYTQPFLPVTYQKEDNFNTFIELDPLQNKIIENEPGKPKLPSRRDIYDPRNTGYGTQYRTYIEPVTGQPRFYYNDIDQQNNNGYLTRNNIDFADFGTSTGAYPFNKPLEGNALYNYSDETFGNSILGYRTELQQRLMKKNNNREWQQRIAPIRTNIQTKGFMGTSSSGNYAGPRG